MGHRVLTKYRHWIYNSNMKTLISIKTEPEVKEQAQKLASEMGITLSALVTIQLKQAIRTQTVTLSAESYTPTPYLEKILEKADKDIKAGRNLEPTIANKEDLDNYFATL